MARSSAAVLAYLSKTDVELAITFTKIHEMNFRLAGIPIDYPYGGPIDLDPVAMHALFEYGERCAEQGLLWTTPPEALHRRQAGLERYESKPNPEKPIAPKDVPCPAASTDTHPPKNARIRQALDARQTSLAPSKSRVLNRQRANAADGLPGVKSDRATRAISDN